MGVVVEGPFSPDERPKIVNEIAHLFNDSAHDACKRGEIVRGWDLDAWCEGELVLVPKLSRSNPTKSTDCLNTSPPGCSVHG